MPRFRARSQLALPVTLIVTVAFSLLPAQWRLPWSKELSNVVQIPLRPFSHGADFLGSWLRPAATPAEVSGETIKNLDQAIIDRDKAMRLYHAERQRADDLEEQLRQLQQIPTDARRFAESSIIARVTSRTADPSLGLVEVILDRGAQDLVQPENTIAVYGGVHLLGRVMEESSGRACLIKSITNPSTGFLRAKVYPKDQPNAEGRQLIVEPAGNGTFTGDIDHDIVIGQGDVVRLDDPRWPRTAAGMVIGEVYSVRVKDAEPLRNTVVVKPVYTIQEVAYVTLIIESQEAEANLESGGGAP